jgi:hypothetical protein
MTTANRLPPPTGSRGRGTGHDHLARVHVRADADVVFGGPADARTYFVPPGRYPVAITQATMAADDYPSWPG